MATAWIDERRPDGLVVARGVGRPLWLGHGRYETFFASTKHTLELIERYLDLRLSKREVPEGSRVTIGADGDVDWASFRPTSTSRNRRCPPCGLPRSASRACASSPRSSRPRSSPRVCPRSTGLTEAAGPRSADVARAS